MPSASKSLSAAIYMTMVSSRRAAPLSVESSVADDGVSSFCPSALTISDESFALAQKVSVPKLSEHELNSKIIHGQMIIFFIVFPLYFTKQILRPDQSRRNHRCTQYLMRR